MSENPSFDQVATAENAAITLDNNVAIPEIAHTLKYPFEQMAVGQSFFVPEAKARNVRSSVGHYQRRETVAAKFITRTVTEEGIKGVRVWRAE